MDYEKKYNETLERAKSIKDSIIASHNKESASFYTGFINNIFPELKESEDERIRKELLEVIKHCYEDGGYALCTDDYKKYSAYLEKQKEQKPAEWSEEDEENFKWFDKFFRAESIVVGGRDIPQDKYLWFKSLRPQPHWKPSEEQMEALMRAITWLVENGNHTVSSTLAAQKRHRNL